MILATAVTAVTPVPSLVPRPVSALGVLHHLPKRERVWRFAYSDHGTRNVWVLTTTAR